MVAATCFAAWVLVAAASAEQGGEQPGARPDAGAPSGAQGRAEEPAPRRSSAYVPVLIDVTSEVGRRYKLTEATVLLDGAAVVRLKASPGTELQRNFRVFEGAVPPGEHAVTVALVYDGRNPGFIDYFDNYHFRVESTGAFTVATGEQRPAVIQVVARERAGNVPFDQKFLVQVVVAPGSGAALTTPSGRTGEQSRP
jgi:hypothetical protein